MKSRLLIATLLAILGCAAWSPWVLGAKYDWEPGCEDDPNKDRYNSSAPKQHIQRETAFLEETEAENQPGLPEVELQRINAQNRDAVQAKWQTNLDSISLLLEQNNNKYLTVISERGLDPKTGAGETILEAKSYKGIDEGISDCDKMESMLTEFREDLNADMKNFHAGTLSSEDTELGRLQQQVHLRKIAWEKAKHVLENKAQQAQSALIEEAQHKAPIEEQRRKKEAVGASITTISSQLAKNQEEYRSIIKEIRNNPKTRLLRVNLDTGSEDCDDILTKLNELATTAKKLPIEIIQTERDQILDLIQDVQTLQEKWKTASAELTKAAHEQDESERRQAEIEAMNDAAISEWLARYEEQIPIANQIEQNYTDYLALLSASSRRQAKDDKISQMIQSNLRQCTTALYTLQDLLNYSQNFEQKVKNERANIRAAMGKIGTFQSIWQQQQEGAQVQAKKRR